MSDLVPSVVPLSAGLSLQVPKLLAPPGSLLDVINYEQVDTQGQKRIDGYARYDGGLISAINDFKVVSLADLEQFDMTFNIYYTSADLGIPKPVAIRVGGSGDYAHVVSLNDNLMPPHTNGRDTYTDPEQHYEMLLQYMNVLRERTEELPGPVAGLHWFRDRLYAVASTARLAVSTDYVRPNDVINMGGYSAKVLDSTFVGNGVYHVYISALNAKDWAAPDIFVDVSGRPGTTTAYFESTLAKPIASLYESRSEAQVFAEAETTPMDFGWRFVDLGWEVGFKGGLSLYGGLPALNQNLGAIGAGWSSTGGNTGSPLVLTQDIDIPAGRPQVNGWKNSNTPSTYGLSPSNITSTNDSYIYADAYVSWDGTTRAITVARDNLTEYPATATVEVEI